MSFRRKLSAPANVVGLDCLRWLQSISMCATGTISRKRTWWTASIQVRPVNGNWVSETERGKNIVSTYRKVWQRMSGALNVSFNNFVFNENQFLFRIQFGLFDNQLNQFSMSFGGCAQFCRGQDIHANLEFVGRNVLKNESHENFD